MHGQVPELTPEDLEVADADHGMISVVHEAHCDGILVQEGVDTDAVPTLIRMKGGKELVLLELALAHLLLVLGAGIELLNGVLKVFQGLA